MGLKYRSEIDGLRALAVIPVVFFHAGLDLFSGGFVGVDVFFVISGYLITTIILKELENNSFSIKYFYERRARRILPALFFMIYISSIFAFVLLTRSELGSYFSSVSATILFYSNFYFWKTAPYFESEAELVPLIHTWSLSIEEQFYILVPILLLLSYKYIRKYIFFVLGIIFFCSLFICQLLAIKTGGTLNFYFTLARGWELALGGLAAHFLLKNKVVVPQTISNFFSSIGLALILFSTFYFSRLTLYPSLYTLLPTIGTVLIIIFANEHSYVKKILSQKLFVSLGLISYSFYLWHQPLLAFSKVYFDELTHLLTVATISAALFLSFLSYNFIEKPFRNKDTVSTKSLFRILTILISTGLIISYLSSNFFGANSKNSTEHRLAKLLINQDAVYSTKMDDRQFIKNRISLENLNPQTLVIGSSRVWQISSDIYDNELLNLGVAGASLEDHIAIAEMAIEKFKSKQILLGVDPWLLNKYNFQTRWKSLSNEYKLAIQNIRLSNTKNQVLASTSINLDYYVHEKILGNIYSFLNIRNLASTVDYDKDERNFILRDGRLVYGKNNRETDIKGQIIKYSMYRYQFSNEFFDIYGKFINYLKNVRKMDVVLVLTPFHQLSYDLTKKETSVFLELEEKFRALSKREGVRIVGSYDPSKTKCKLTEFYDSLHPKGICMKRIVENIK